MQLGINYIDKSDFLALSASNIQNGFGVTGLAFYQSDKVLSHLDV